MLPPPCLYLSSFVSVRGLLIPSPGIVQSRSHLLTHSGQVGGVTILLDCGWDIHFETSLLEPLREVVNRVDLVLISHPDLEHLGVSLLGVLCAWDDSPSYCFGLASFTGERERNELTVDPVRSCRGRNSRVSLLELGRCSFSYGRASKKRG